MGIDYGDTVTEGQLGSQCSLHGGEFAGFPFAELRQIGRGCTPIEFEASITTDKIRCDPELPSTALRVEQTHIRHEGKGLTGDAVYRPGLLGLRRPQSDFE